MERWSGEAGGSTEAEVAEDEAAEEAEGEPGEGEEADEEAPATPLEPESPSCASAWRAACRSAGVALSPNASVSKSCRR